MLGEGSLMIAELPIATVVCLEVSFSVFSLTYSSSPQLFRHEALVLWKTVFPRGWQWGWGNGSDLPTAHLLLCGLVRNRPRTSTGLRPGCWGPLIYIVLLKFCFFGVIMLTSKKISREVVVCLLFNNVCGTSLVVQ